MSSATVSPAPASPAGLPIASPAAASAEATPQHRAALLPQLPPTGAATAAFAGFDFHAADAAPHLPGIVILTCGIGGLQYPAFIGDGEDMAEAAATARDRFPAELAHADGLFVLERANARVRAATARELVGKYDPPLNTAHRKAPAAPAIRALIADQADPAALAGSGEQLTAPLQVTEDDLDRLVHEFYAAAGDDPLLGPVFSRAIPDWESHYRIVQNFWSRTLLGTARYSGTPFSAHLGLKLTPAHFERWVALFKQTAQRVLEPVAAARAIAKVEHMSACFQAGLFPPALSAGARHAAHPGG